MCKPGSARPLSVGEGAGVALWGRLWGPGPQLKVPCSLTICPGSLSFCAPILEKRECRISGAVQGAYGDTTCSEITQPVLLVQHHKKCLAVSFMEGCGTEWNGAQPVPCLCRAQPGFCREESESIGPLSHHGKGGSSASFLRWHRPPGPTHNSFGRTPPA